MQPKSRWRRFFTRCATKMPGSKISLRNLTKSKAVQMKPAKKTSQKTTKNASAKKPEKKKEVKPPSLPGADEHLHRVRQMCMALPGTTEKLSHGAPTFFADKRVYAMFVDNHHNDGHLALWIPVPDGSQATLIKTEPKKFYMPPY